MNSDPHFTPPWEIESSSTDSIHGSLRVLLCNISQLCARRQRQLLACEAENENEGSPLARIYFSHEAAIINFFSNVGHKKPAVQSCGDAEVQDEDQHDDPVDGPSVQEFWSVMNAARRFVASHGKGESELNDIRGS